MGRKHTHTSGLKWACMLVYIHHIEKAGGHQSSMVANLSCGQLYRGNFTYFCSRLRIWSLETGSDVLSRKCLLTGSFLPLSSMACTYTVSCHRVNSKFIGSRKCLPIQSTAIGSVPRLSSHTTAYQWRSLQRRVCRHLVPVVL